MSINIPTTRDHDKNYERSDGGDSACIVCGRNTSNPGGWLMVDMCDTSIALDVNEFHEAHEPAEFPIGPDCLKNNPQLKPYLAG